ncbi:hypothetical protein SSTU70S_04946 [Stutzerimonas stutzeri]
MRYPSDIIDRPLHMRPDPGLPAWKGSATCCSHCSRPIEEGDLYSPVALKEFFSDTRSLAAPNGLCCWRCINLRKMPLLYGLGAALITPEAVFPISKDIHKAWAFLTPPPAPFLAVHASSTMQHLTWRTPVTTDNRRIQVRYGNDLFIVRRGSGFGRSRRLPCEEVDEAECRWFDRALPADYSGPGQEELVGMIGGLRPPYWDRTLHEPMCVPQQVV